MFSHVMLGCSDRERSQQILRRDARRARDRAGAGLRQVRLVDDARRRARHRRADRRPAVQPSAMARPSGSGADSPEAVDAWHAAGVANGGTAIEDPPGIRDAGSARCTSPICAIPTATSSAASTGSRPTSELGDRQREPGARRPATRREASVRRHRHGHDLLDLPAAPGGRRREASGRLVSVGPDLHPRQRDRKRRVSRRLRRARPDLRRAGHEPARRRRAGRSGRRL